MPRSISNLAAEAGQWTDDTAMSLALADSLIKRGKLDAHDLMTRFVQWRRDGRYSCTGTCFDIGITTSAALSKEPLITAYRGADWHHSGSGYLGAVSLKLVRHVDRWL